MRRRMRFHQWWMLLLATLAILSGQGSLLGMERFARRHRKTLNELLGTQIGKPPSDSTLRLLLARLDVEGFEGLLQAWMNAQICDGEAVDTLVCDGKTLQGSIAENACGAARYGLRVERQMQGVAWFLPLLHRPEHQRAIKALRIDPPVAEPTPAGCALSATDWRPYALASLALLVPFTMVV